MANLVLDMRSREAVKMVSAGEPLNCAEPDNAGWVGNNHCKNCGIGFAPRSGLREYTFFGLPNYDYDTSKQMRHYVNASSGRGNSESWTPYWAEVVTLLFRLYQTCPNEFDANTPEAFGNREVVIKIAYALLGRDWYSTLYASVERGYVDIHGINFLADVLREIGIGDGQRVRYPIAYHVQLRSTLVNMLNNFVPASPELYEALTDTRPNSGNTNLFIRACLNKGGFSMLINVLGYFFGSYMVTCKEDRRYSHS